MKDGFIKVATATPKIKVADCKFNCECVIEIINKAQKDGVKLAVFPELCLTGYTCGDLFFHDTLLNGAKDALFEVVKATENKDIITVVGLPVKKDGKLYNCAAVILNGEILGIIPKTAIPDYNELSETRYFVSGKEIDSEIEIFGKKVPFSTKLVFSHKDLTDFSFAVEICEDLFSVCPPSAFYAVNGAQVILNLSASNETVCKADFRRETVKNISARLICAYLFANAGEGESTTDTVFAGHNLICENGKVIAESERFTTGYITTEIDVKKLAFQRSKINTFPKSDEEFRKIEFFFALNETSLSRKVSKTPFIPETQNEKTARAEDILKIQSAGLEKRLTHSHAKTAVVGISGGLDSALALIVTAHAMDNLGRPRTDIIAVSMPCFGTTKRTKTNAQILCEGLGVNFSEIDITNSVKAHFKDISHSEDNHDITFENAQARERTQLLMDIANQNGGLVVGTGDLSELALGWATYNGDHMSMYALNSGVPKTLVRHLVEFEANRTPNEKVKSSLCDILLTPVSPELIPAKNGEITQKTEDLVGPYELHDFFIYYTLRWGYEPKKLYRLARYAFCDSYDGETIKKWLKTFYSRFFSQQFKRSCVPDGVKIGSVGLSPRGDLKLPSDAVNTLWLNQL